MSEDFVRDGMLHCGKCGTPKQKDVEGIGRVPILCKCESERLQREKAEMERESRYLDARHSVPSELRLVPEGDYCDERVGRWLAKWPEMQGQNIGLLLWGDVGTGKTSSAAHVVRKLDEQYVPCLMTSLGRLIDLEHGRYATKLNRFDLLVLDDLGVERTSEYMTQKVYEIIDERVSRRKPMILTTNLSLSAMQHEADISRRRIYDRILSVCVPVRFRGESHRAVQAKEALETARKIIGAAGGDIRK